MWCRWGVGVGGVELIQMQRYALKVAEEVGVRAVEVLHLLMVVVAVHQSQDQDQE